MNSSTYAIVIGILSCISYFVVSIKIIGDLIKLEQLPVKPHNYGINKAVLLLTVIFCLIMTAVSVLMVHGVRKTRHSLIAPWVLLGVIDIVANTLKFLTTGLNQSAFGIIANILCLVIYCLIWYLIYSLWKDMRQGKIIDTQTDGSQQSGELTTPSGVETQGSGYISVPQNVA